MKVKLEYIVIVILVLALLWLFLSPAHPEPQTPPPSLAAHDAEKPELVLFYANWCGHCKELNRRWGELEQHINAIGGNVAATKIESNNPEMKQHMIKGFPTLRLFPKGRQQTDVYIEYQGEREPESIAEFVREYVTQPH